MHTIRKLPGMELTLNKRYLLPTNSNLMKYMQKGVSNNLLLIWKIQYLLTSWQEKLNIRKNQNVLVEFQQIVSYNWYTGFKSINQLFIKIANNVLLLLDLCIFVSYLFQPFMTSIKIKNKNNKTWSFLFLVMTN